MFANTSTLRIIIPDARVLVALITGLFMSQIFNFGIWRKCLASRLFL